MQRANDENRILLCGSVETEAAFDHSLYGEDFYAFRVAVPRLSGAVDVLPVTLPQRLMGPSPEAGMRILIAGQLRSYNKHTEAGSRLVLTVFAHTLEYPPDDLPPCNEVTLTGYLCKHAVLRTTPFLREIGDMLLAVNRAYNKSDYLPCIAWGRNARFAAETPVGSHLAVAGRLQSREYQKCVEDGSLVTRTAYEVSCGSLELIP